MSATLQPKTLNVRAEYLALSQRMRDASAAEKLAVCIWAKGLREQLDAEQQLEHDRAIDRVVAELLK